MQYDILFFLGDHKESDESVATLEKLASVGGKNAVNCSNNSKQTAFKF